MIAQSSNGNCIARAISTMRLALGYETGLLKMFECPVCGVDVTDDDDMLICDECLAEALAIREIQFQLEDAGLAEEIEK